MKQKARGLKLRSKLLSDIDPDIEVQPEAQTFGYVRVSTDKQELSPDAQKEKIKAYCKFKGLPDPAIFVDSAVSGSTPITDREAGRELMGRLRPGDHVVISRLDRAFRSLADAVQVLQRMQRLGVSLHVCDHHGGAVDLGSPSGRAMVHMMCVFAQFEREQLTERTREAMNEKRRRGEPLNQNPRAGFRLVYKRVDGKQVAVGMEPDPEWRRVMGLIVEMRDQDPPPSFFQIYQTIKYELKIPKPGVQKFKEWAPHIVRNWYFAEKALREQEAKEAKAKLKEIEGE